MDDMHGASGHDRREVFGLVGAVGIGALALDTTASAQSSITTSDILAETLIRAGAHDATIASVVYLKSIEHNRG